MHPYSCSSSIGTEGASWGAIRRPVTGVAESRLATMVLPTAEAIDEGVLSQVCGDRQLKMVLYMSFGLQARNDFSRTPRRQT
jgi:hypothetical protein